MRTREPAASEGLVHVPDAVNVCTLIPAEAGADEIHAVPLLVITFAEVPGVTATTDVPPIVVAPLTIKLPAVTFPVKVVVPV
jgi:hypothetical protein